MEESPIFSRTYDMLLWLIPQVQKFPRVHRFGLAERITRKALDFQETLVAAVLHRGVSRRDLLDQADVQLAQLRYHIRLSHDLKLFSTGQYAHVSGMIVEIGRLLGGWKKKASGRGAGR